MRYGARTVELDLLNRTRWNVSIRRRSGHDSLDRLRDRLVIHPVWCGIDSREAVAGVLEKSHRCEQRLDLAGYPLVCMAPPQAVWSGRNLFFLKAGAFVFDSGLAIVPFLYGGVVSQYHWLTERQFVDAIAVAMIAPGPVVITAAFIGYLVAGLIGGTAAAAAVFAPPFLIVILAAPYYRRFAGNPQVKAFVQGVMAAAVVAIAEQ
jgi:putative chromate ion transporter